MFFRLIRAQLSTPLKSFEHHRNIELRSLRGALNWALIMPRDVGLSDSGCNFFSPTADRMGGEFVYNLFPSDFMYSRFCVFISDEFVGHGSFMIFLRVS